MLRTLAGSLAAGAVLAVLLIGLVSGLEALPHWAIVFSGALIGTTLTLPFFMAITTLVMSAVKRRSMSTFDEEVFRTPLFWVFFVPTTAAFWLILIASNSD